MLEMIKNALPRILDDLPLFPEQASTVAFAVDLLYIVWIVISAFFTLLISIAAIWLMVQYRRRSEDEVGAPELHAPLIEAGSMALPFVVAMAMFLWGTFVFVDLRRPPADAIEYFAFGKQWMWKYQHPNGKREINDLTVPVNTPIKLTMTSEDVIHSFFVPEFRVKQDVVPGRYTTVWFEATKTGQYRQLCTEYCGTEHSLMGGIVTVVEQDDYEAFLLGGDGAVGGPASAGEELFTSLACVTCHLEDDGGRGPSLIDLFGSETTLASGETIPADENYLRESILTPMKQVKTGYMPLMPTFEGQVSEEQLVNLINYIKSLASEQTAEAGAASAEISTGG